MQALTGSIPESTCHSIDVEVPSWVIQVASYVIKETVDLL